MYIQRIAEETGISERAIRMEYNAGEAAPPPRRSTPESERRASADLSEEELTLLKLMLLSERFMELPEDVASHVLTDGYGETVYQKLLSMKDAPRPIPVSALEDDSDPDLQGVLRSIDAVMIPPDREEIAFRDCLAFARRKELRKKEQEISWKLSLAEENASEEEQNELMRQMAEIQKKLKGQ